MQSNFHEHTLPNGLRVVCEVLPRVTSAAAGILVRTGSRHEVPELHGVSHYLEHMCFKGSARRSCRELNVRFDELGSIYNAFTGKEHTVYYGWLPAERIDDQIELLADLVQPILDPGEYETERNVILEEIAMGDDSFERHLSNFLHRVVFADGPLAHEILGEKETIAALPRDAMARYLRARYVPRHMTLVVSGAIDPDAIFAAAERYCGAWRDGGNGLPLPDSSPPLTLRGRACEVLPQFGQQAVIEVFPALPHGCVEEETIEAFTGLFGGANSRCYWNIVQKGICLHAGAAWIAYEDCGVMALYAEGEPQRCEEMLAALRTQAAEVVAGGFRPDEVQRIRNQRRTQLALEGENPRTRLMQVIDDIETRGRPRPRADRMAAVEAVSAESIAEYLRRFPITGDGLLLSIGPRAWP